MKSKIIILVSFVYAFSLTGCIQQGALDMDLLQVSQVSQLYEPDNGQDVILQVIPGAALQFEWAPAIAADGGYVLYEIAFDRVNGDFSDPVFKMASNNNGANNIATVTHKQLNVIAALVGIDALQQGDFKWTVFSTKGITQTKAAVERTLTVTRLAGFADLPENLYITGAATEVGANLSDALVMKEVTEGEFEVYIRLTAGQSFGFVNETTGASRSFYLDGVEIKEGTGSYSVGTTGVFQLYLDFTTGSFTIREILRVALFHNANQVNLWLPYQGLGVWGRTFVLTADELFNNPSVATTTSDNAPTNNPVTSNLGTDDRYKFRMVSRPIGGDEVVTEWRTALSNDSKPGASPNPNWYWMQERSNVAQWTNNEIWKINPSAWMGITLDVTFVLKSDGAYTHTLAVR